MDLTDRPAADEGVDVAASHLERALEAAGVAAWEWELSGNTMTSSANLLEMYRIPVLETAEDRFASVHPDDLGEYQATISQALLGGDPYVAEFRVVHPDSGTVFWLEERGTPIHDPDGSVAKLAGVVMDVTDRRRADEASRGQAELLDLTYDAILVREFESDVIRFWNRGAEEMYGFSRDQAVGRVSHDLLATVHSVPVPEAKEIALNTGRWEGELVHTRSDGTKIVVASRWIVQVDGGKPIAILETNTDITEQKRASESMEFLADASDLLASSLDYETTLASLARLAVPRVADWCAIHLVDDAGQVRQISVVHPDPAKVELARELEKRYPYDPDAPAGVPEVLRTGRPELVADIPDELLVAASPDADLLRILRELGLKSSMIVPLSARGHAHGAITFIAAESGRHFTFDDLTLAQQLADRAALAVDNAQLYREAMRTAAETTAILSQMVDGVLLCDMTGQVTFMNEAAKRLYDADFTGMSLADYRPDAPVRDTHGTPYELGALPLQRALVDGETTMVSEALILRPDGTEVTVQRSATPVTAEDGTRLGATMTVRDVTEQRDLDRQKDEFLGSVAHDLKTPLTGLKGLAQVLHRRVSRGTASDPERLLEGLDRIDRTATRMSSLIDQLLDITRLQMGGELELNLREFDLLALLSRVAADMAGAGSRHRISIHTSLSDLPGQWDADRIDRVFSNLLSNAMKYSPDGASIEMTASREQRDGREWAAISVSDSGLGIPAAELPHIFDRFHRASNVPSTIGGTGIGLTGARQIVEQHGGTIEVVSSEGAGSTFTVRLPLHSDSTGSSDADN